jgi:alpha-ketoglutarate-dependent taurine dioxygenase
VKQLYVSYRAPDIGRRIDLTSADQAESLVDEISHAGFAVADLGVADNDPTAVIARVSDWLGLGEPQVPALYRLKAAAKYSSPYQGIQGDTTDGHPGFGTTAGQEWHVDGLLDDIGALKTTVLYCVQPAHSGGVTEIFNAVAAFQELRNVDLQAAEALLSPTALERRATIPGVDAKAIGPVFALEADGEVSTRFTDNDTCVWDYAAGSAGSLERALKFLRQSTKDARYRTSARLAAGEALIFRNDRVAHGRTPYQDEPKARRLLIRSIYSRAPRSTGEGRREENS